MKNSCSQAFKQIRLANELTQNQFSERLDITASYVEQIEQGKAFPSYDLLYKVVERFNIDANLFFGGGNAQTVIDDSFYKLVSAMSPNQLNAIKGLLKFVTNVSIINSEMIDDTDEGEN